MVAGEMILFGRVSSSKLLLILGLPSPSSPFQASCSKWFGSHSNSHSLHPKLTIFFLPPAGRDDLLHPPPPRVRLPIRPRSARSSNRSSRLDQEGQSRGCSLLTWRETSFGPEGGKKSEVDARWTSWGDGAHLCEVDL